MADFLVDRFSADVVLEQWMNEVKMPHSTLLHGKSVVDETNASFTGTYVGAASDPQVKRWIEDADIVINVGVLFTDIITVGLSHHLTIEKCITIHPFEERVE